MTFKGLLSEVINTFPFEFCLPSDCGPIPVSPAPIMLLFELTAVPICYPFLLDCTEGLVELAVNGF
jgi:hypothetical protein